MKYIIVLIIAAIAIPVHADECSNEINGYLEGLTVGSTMAAVNDAARKSAHDQIEYITSLREYKEDCDIVELIPPLKGSKEAIEQATKAISESRQVKIEFEALDNSGCIHFHSSTEINPHALLEISKSKEKIVRDKGEEWARGAVPALGKSLIETAIKKELGDAVNDAAIQVSMAAWLYDSIYRGLNADTFVASNLRFTMMPDGSVKYDRFLSELPNMSR